MKTKNKLEKDRHARKRAAVVNLKYWQELKDAREKAAAEKAAAEGKK